MSQRSGQSRKPYRDPVDAIVGLIVGVLWGAGSAFAIGIYVIPDSRVLFGTAMVISSVVFGILGYLKGDDFFRWVRDHWFL